MKMLRRKLWIDRVQAFFFGVGCGAIAMFAAAHVVLATTGAKGGATVFFGILLAICGAVAVYIDSKD